MVTFPMHGGVWWRHSDADGNVLFEHESHDGPCGPECSEPEGSADE